MVRVTLALTGLLVFAGCDQFVPSEQHVGLFISPAADREPLLPVRVFMALKYMFERRLADTESPEEFVRQQGSSTDVIAASGAAEIVLPFWDICSLSPLASNSCSRDGHVGDGALGQVYYVLVETPTTSELHELMIAPGEISEGELFRIEVTSVGRVQVRNSHRADRQPGSLPAPPQCNIRYIIGRET